MKGRTVEQQSSTELRQMARLSGVCALASAIAGMRSAEEIPSLLAAELNESVPYSIARLVLVDFDEGLEIGAVWRPGGPVEELPTATIPDSIPKPTLLTEPLVHNERPLGFLSLERDKNGTPFDSDDATLAKALGDLIVSALGSAWRHEESEKRRRELTEIIDIGRSFAAVTNAHDLRRAIAERAARIVGAGSCFVATCHPRRNTVTAESPGYNVDPEAIGEFRFPVDSGEGGIDTFRWIEPFYSNAPETDMRFSTLRSERYSPQSILCAPMRAKGETVGFLFAADRPDGFDHKAARLLGAIAPQAAAALSNAQLLESAEARAQREALLNHITTSVRESLEIDDVLHTTVKLLGQSLDLDRCFVAFVDRTRRTVSVIHEYHVPEVGSTMGEFPIAQYGPSLLGQMESGEIFAIHEVDRDPRTKPFYESILKPLSVRSLMYVPVPTEQRLWPVIGFSQVRRSRHWTDEEIEFARAIANQVAVAMRQAQLYDRERSEARNRALLNRINRAVRASLDVDTILETMVEALGSALQVDRCFVLAPGPFTSTVETATVRFEYCRPGIASIRGLKVPVRNRAREGPVGMIEEPLAISDIAENPRLVSSRKAELLANTDTRAMLSIRAIYGDQVLAILELNQCFEARAWTREEIDLVGEVAALLAVGIHNALLFRRVTGSEQQWNTTFNSMTDGLAILDPNGNVLRLNDSLLKLCGLESTQSAIGRHCYELLYGEADTLRDGPVERVLSTGQRVQIERDIPVRGIALRESIDPIFDDEQKIAGLVLVVRDVTRERDTERAIRYRNRQLAALNAIAAATIHAVDLQSIVEGAFARIVDVTGADAGALLTLDDEGNWLDPVATHGGAARTSELVNRDASSPAMAEVLAADVPLAIDEFPTNISGVPLTDPQAIVRTGLTSALYAAIRSQRRAVGMIVIAYTARRSFSANERQLLTVAGQQLGVAIENARLIANLQQALESVREANRLKDEFLATVSHELRTPLTAIQGWAEVLGDPDTSDAETKEGLATIQQSSESLTKLISDLLEMSRIETRMLRLDLSTIDPNYPVQAAIQTVRHMADAKGVTISVELARDLPPVEADSGRLQQVLWNLLANAIKFTPSGGNVWASTHAVDGCVVIRVRDDGIGIDADFLPFAFERFRQADGSATRQFGGLGIGLSLVKSLVEAHGGSVEASSAGTGLGSTFTVSLPAAGH